MQKKKSQISDLIKISDDNYQNKKGKPNGLPIIFSAGSAGFEPVLTVLETGVHHN